MVCTVGQGGLPKTIVPMDFIDLWVTIQGDLHGKVEQTCLVDLDFTDTVEYPHMAIHSFMDCVTLPNMRISMVVET
jgi:hypothetical protein